MASSGMLHLHDLPAEVLGCIADKLKRNDRQARFYPLLFLHARRPILSTPTAAMHAHIRSQLLPLPPCAAAD